MSYSAITRILLFLNILVAELQVLCHGNMLLMLTQSILHLGLTNYTTPSIYITLTVVSVGAVCLKGYNSF